MNYLMSSQKITPTTHKTSHNNSSKRYCEPAMQSNSNYQFQKQIHTCGATFQRNLRQ